MKKNLLLKLYKNLQRFRSIELEISKRYSSWKMRCPTHLSVGQEAVPAAFSEIVKKNDFAVSSHRAHAHYLAKGGNLNKMIAELYGKKTGCSKGKGGSMHLIDLATSWDLQNSRKQYSCRHRARSSKIKIQTKKLCFFGDGALEQGVFYESVNFAAVKNLPIVFVCENNLYSVYSNMEHRQPNNRKNFKMVEAIGVKSLLCDGNNVEQCYKIFKKAAAYVEKKSKPIFLEFLTYRHLEHCGPNIDDNLEYRPRKEIELWKRKRSYFSS